MVLFLILALFINPGGICLCACALPATAGHIFLNDRSANIIGSAPLLIPGLLTTAGLSGKGQIIGIADSGLDKGSTSDIHPDLQSDPGSMPRVAMLKSYTDREIADDPNGHGTHMAAAIAGSGKASEGKYRGIAPGTSLYFQALLDEEGNLKVPENIKSIFEPAYAAGVRIHVDGWGRAGNTYAKTSAQIDNFVFNYPDFLPVFGAGNSGPGNGTLTMEANSKNALVVGSSQVPRPTLSPEARYAGEAANSSSRGPAQDGRIKPELLAPGSAVISACSSLTESNFAANSQYTLMGGSSMAAAVTGGALALLREYLNGHEGVKNPGSALLKALLVNGANFGEEKLKEQGFGILDLSGTILALQEDRFKFVEEKGGIQTENSREYKVQVSDGSLPFKASLAWVDPPGKAGEPSNLVNNLDLIVRDPQGKIYYGNDFLKQGYADSVNNLEQVFISKPLPGSYSIIVRAVSLDSSFPSQSFSLVYGQPLKHAIVQSMDENKTVKLADGEEIDLAESKLFCTANGSAFISDEQIEPGADIYLTGNSAYVFGQSWKYGGLQVLSEQGGTIISEISSQKREGGYYIDPQASLFENYLWLNGISISDINSIPSGSEIYASLNPGLQTAWQVKAEYEEVSGFIEGVNAEPREIKLLHDEHKYLIKEQTAISYNDILVDCSDIAAPYGSAETATLEKLAPGMKVSLVISPGTRDLLYVRVERQIIIGSVQSIDAQQGNITMDTGKSYKIFPGTRIMKNGQSADLKDLLPEDKIAALLLDSTNKIIQLTAITDIAYGRVVHYNSRDKKLHIFDANNSIISLQLNRSTEIFRRGLQIEASLIEPGSWVRVISDPESREVWRLDIAELAENVEKVLASYDAQQGTLIMQDGSRYTCSRYSQISKGGYIISPDLLRPGSKLIISTLESPSPWAEFLVRVEEETGPGVQAPQLIVRAYSLNGVLIVQGKSSADRVIMYRENEERNDIKCNDDGSFSHIYTLFENEKQLRVLAINSQTGAIRGVDVYITEYPVEQGAKGFNDIYEHPAGENILNLGKQGVISGYPDGTFRPDNTLTRAEFTSILARAWDWNLESKGETNYFKDNGQIPWWASGAVYAARKLGVASGYHDGSFRPGQAISRSEMAAMIARVLSQEKKDDKDDNQKDSEESTYNASSSIPAWAEGYIETLYQAGLLQSLDGELFEPDGLVTRAEAAVIIDRLHKKSTL